MFLLALLKSRKIKDMLLQLFCIKKEKYCGSFLRLLGHEN